MNNQGSEMAEKKLDAVDQILEQWRNARPDLDCSPMENIGRLRRCSDLLGRALDATFNDFGMSAWEFDMLATLRRSSTTFCMSPTDLFSKLMVTSGTMTHRLQKLEASGWITRLQNPDDARSMLVQLTDAGKDLVDRALLAHVENERRIMSGLSVGELKQLNEGLRAMLAVLERV
ncbi:MarR family transcriptional regulator [Undibacterium sp. TS12]|uniref:MarR family winged helix-turn-helix transcriptional regulator n=1 Tax=Undibacterium sp. TS12 TaxID=2908202 RepID=UPI001F4CE2F9|nr:MarR family transcriptional regulator [Undibacterium sp. TS12]MCH8623081.1 MarR family transcriptional regulator [Undibacterium sp. TS12]